MDKIYLRFILVSITISVTINVCHGSEDDKLLSDPLEAYPNETLKHEEEHSRQKRQLPLMFPQGGTSKLLIGWAVPFDNPMKINLVFAVNFQYQYAVPPNITFFTQYYPFTNINVTTGKRSADYDERATLYMALEKTMDGIGVNGQSCLLRTICEAAETPIHHNGLFGELLHVIFTPPYNIDSQMTGTSHEDSYGSARRAGEQLYDCRKLYPSCPMGHGIFDIISYLE